MVEWPRRATLALLVAGASLCALPTAEAVAQAPPAPAECSAGALGPAFAAPALSGSTGAGDVDCYTLPGLSEGDSFRVWFRPEGLSGVFAQWAVVDPAGSSVCSGAYVATTECDLTGTGAGPWRLLVHGIGTDDFSYLIAARRLTNPQGCAPLGDPDVWSFTAPRIDGNIDDPLGARCYTFSRAFGETDGAYWFRSARTTGLLSPRWRVYGPTGERACEGADSGYQVCPLQAFGQFSLVVDDWDSREVGTYFLTAHRITTPAGCTDLSSVSFAGAAVSGSTAPGEVDCHTLPGLAAGDKVEIPFRWGTGFGEWTLVDAAGSRVCSSGNSVECDVSGPGPWRLLVAGIGQDQFSYSVAAHRLTHPEGCVPLGEPQVWSFTAPRLSGSIDSALATRCYTFSRAPGEADGAYWFQTERASGELSPRWRVYSPSGSRPCEGSSGFQACPLQASGQFAVIVDDQSGTQTGSYFLAPRRLTAPTGCNSLPSISSGIAPVSGNLSTAGEVDCYSLTASSGDQFTFSGTGAATGMALVGHDGARRCDWWGLQCTIDESGEHTLLVYSAFGPSTGLYTFEASCDNQPCGQNDTAVTEVAPNRVGPSRFTTLLLRGRDLNLLDSAKLVRGGREIAGDVQESASGGRAREVRFDLTGAEAGAWELQAAFNDGTSRTLLNAVTVEPLRPADISVDVVGREVFRAGQPTSLTVVVSNSGNEDGVAVPVYLRGIPAGSTIEPVFDLHEPSGAPGAITMKEAQFDQETDTLSENGEIFAPFLVARVPAGRAVQMEFRITTPEAGDYTVHAEAGDCLSRSFQSSGSELPELRGAGSDQSFVNCAGATTGLIVDALSDQVIPVPGRSCVKLGSDVAMSAVESADGGEKFWGWGHGFSWFIQASECLADFVPGTTLAKAAAKAAVKIAADGEELLSLGMGAADCVLAYRDAKLEQRAVASIDPNDIVGPAGSGAKRFISGETPLAYQVLFENLPSASAPAQRVAITNQLDPSIFDPATVLFDGVRFGDTTYSLPFASHEVDHTIDLRPAQNLHVHVTAGVTDDGRVHWELQAIDPATQLPPDDPLAGFLPPNQDAPEGEGSVSYTVGLAGLPSGASVTNKASIVFDNNAPIETPTWINTIDKLPPTARVSADGTSDPTTATVDWSGADDAAGISLYEVRVAKDGGSFALWRVSEGAGSGAFTADEAGTYSFRVVAHDDAGNVGQSGQAAIRLGPHVVEHPGDGGDGTITKPPGGKAKRPKPTLSRSALTLGRDGRVRMRVGCKAGGPKCSGTLTLKHKRLKVGSTHFSIRAGRTTTVAIRLTRAGRSLLKQRGRLRVKVTATIKGRATSATVTLKLAKRKTA